MLIGTPGRIIDYLKQGVYDLRHAQVLVLDEADRMFDLGFIADIRYILRRLPAPDRRQSMLFSATLSQRVLELAYEHMNNPELVRIEPDKVTIDRVRQAIYFPSMPDKIPLLVHLLRESEAHRTMVFVNTKRMAERLEAWLRANGFNAQAISGDVPQPKRLEFLRQFHEGELAVLIATDVASRGLHIPGRQPRVQLRPAAGCARLRAPHRPHGARRRGRRCHQLRLRGVRDFAAGHRELHRPQDSGRALPAREPAQAPAGALRAARPRRAAPARRRWWWGRRWRWPGGPRAWTTAAPLRARIRSTVLVDQGPDRSASASTAMNPSCGFPRRAEAGRRIARMCPMPAARAARSTDGLSSAKRLRV